MTFRQIDIEKKKNTPIQNIYPWLGPDTYKILCQILSAIPSAPLSVLLNQHFLCLLEGSAAIVFHAN